MALSFQSIAVSGSDQCDQSFLQTIAEQLQSPLLETNDENTSSYQYLLFLNDDRLELRSCVNKKQGAVYVDFLDGKSRHRRLYGGGKGQDLAKAIGVKKIPNARVIDATAGLGRDGFVLATIGCQLTLIERNPIIYWLLNNALERVSNSEDEAVKQICERIHLLNTSAHQYLSELALSKEDKADVIYLDPMFPERSKSAKVKKDMSFFHDIVGDDPDSDELLRCAIQCCCKRIVVKRPKLAEPLLNRKAAFCIKGKSTRYDVYHPTL